ncbi:uncharacterized protein CLAFUR5_09192 [Fulvia fulva]|uniref:Uncharacterized protein n=1 Tax=Passalora fulva TaxID=5499 RepID=A0A9Q8PH45_PASFU|nr:uncharacterized protein CLAFUR5_09192 [Fulvia fulva]UJO22321.1 hypothetical protein CLAFUR5_09192 [Fulvia fulva]
MPARWEPAERHVVHVARSEFELPWKQIAMIFGDIFKVDWKGTALPKDSQLRQEYQGRKAKMWTQVIIKDEYTSEEKALRKVPADLLLVQHQFQPPPRALQALYLRPTLLRVIPPVIAKRMLDILRLRNIPTSSTSMPYRPNSQNYV